MKVCSAVRCGLKPPWYMLRKPLDSKYSVIRRSNMVVKILAMRESMVMHVVSCVSVMCGCGARAGDGGAGGGGNAGGDGWVSGGKGV